MPQMAPLWWELLFFMFILSFMFMNTIMYFNKNMKPVKSSMSHKLSIDQLKWMW